MKYIKTYENRLTDFFKSKKYDDWDIFMQDNIAELNKSTTLMHCADQGDIKKFRYYLQDHVLHQKDSDGDTVLMHVITGDGSLRNKKEMIKTLIDMGENIFNLNKEGERPFDLIKEPELREWVIKTFPDIEFKINVDKYNL